MTDYETWFSDWMKQLALTYTRSELERQLTGNRHLAERATSAHHRAISATSGMASHSQRRAHARNAAAATGNRGIALRGALRIYDEHPIHTKEGKS